MSSNTSRKARALAAGGAVLGLGAVVTLAAWSDSEFVEGTFGTDNFGIQAATDYESFGEHAEKGSALALTLPDTTLVPGETIALPYQIRNVDGGADSVVTYQGAVSEQTDLTAALTTEFVLIDGRECAPAVAGETLDAGEAFFLDTEKRQQNLCVKVTLSDTYTNPLAQDSTVVWEFVAKEAGTAESV